MSLDLTDDMSTLGQVVAWCHQATSHFLNLSWPSSMYPYDDNRPQWVKSESKHPVTWKHDMKMVSSLLALCEGNPVVTGGFPPKQPLIQSLSFDVFFVVGLKLLNKQSTCQWVEMPWHSHDVTVMIYQYWKLVASLMSPGFFGDHHQNHQCLWFPSCYLCMLPFIVCILLGILLLLLMNDRWYKIQTYLMFTQKCLVLRGSEYIFIIGDTPKLFDPCRLVLPVLIQGWRPANERPRYFVTKSLIGWVQT